MDISIIIVNYNTSNFVKQCIESILHQSGVKYEIIVIDNNSIDSSIEILRTFSDKINLIESDKNLGFGKANNRGFKEASGRYILLLNPDAKLQANDDLEKIVGFMDDNPEYGLVGTKIICGKNESETLPKKFYPGEKYINSPYQQLPGNIAWIIGAVMIFPREVYKKIGGFDEDYFLYCEDAAICLSVRKLGYKIGYFKDVAVLHAAGASERTTNSYDLALKKQKAFYLFYKKHYQPEDVQFLLKKALRQARMKKFLHRLRIMLGLKPSWHKLYTYRAIYDASKQLLGTLRIR